METTKNLWESENPEAVREAVNYLGKSTDAKKAVDTTPVLGPAVAPEKKSEAAPVGKPASAQVSNTVPVQSAEPSRGVVIAEKNIADNVLSKVTALREAGALNLPNEYAVENHLKAAWLVLQETKDRNGAEALKVCTRESIATSLLDMVLQGMSVSKKQGYFIVYGNKLTFMRSYFGTVSIAKKMGMKIDPVANLVYEADDFQFEIDPATGLFRIVKHDQKLANIDDTKIVGAYCIVEMPDGRKQVTIMTMAQIRKSWGQGATKGNSPAHNNFTGEMAKRTVINRALKLFINSSNDAWLYADKRDEGDADTAAEERNAKVAAGTGSRTINAQEVEFEEIKSEADSAPSAATDGQTNGGAADDNEPPYAR